MQVRRGGKESKAGSVVLKLTLLCWLVIGSVLVVMANTNDNNFYKLYIVICPVKNC